MKNLVKVVKPRVASKTWTSNDVPQTATKVLWSTFQTTFPEFIRRVDKITKTHVRVMQSVMKDLMGLTVSDTAMKMQLDRAFGKYVSTKEGIAPTYAETDKLMAQYRDQLTELKKDLVVA